MKKLIPSLVVASVLALGAATASACPGDKGGRMDRVVEKLELTTEQEAQFREIMEAKRDEMKSYHQEQRANTLDQLSNVLTDEQLAEFEEMTERRFRHKGKI